MSSSVIKVPEFLLALEREQLHKWVDQLSASQVSAEIDRRRAIAQGRGLRPVSQDVVHLKSYLVDLLTPPEVGRLGELELNCMTETELKSTLASSPNFVFRRIANDFFTPLHVPCMNLPKGVTAGFLTLVDTLVQAGANIEATSGLLDTPLVLASFNGKLNIVRMLVKAGAIIDRPGENGKTAVEWAADQSKWPVVRYLVSKGANTQRLMMELENSDRSASHKQQLRKAIEAGRLVAERSQAKVTFAGVRCDRRAF